MRKKLKGFETTEEIKAEILRCRADPWHFISSWIYTLDPLRGKLKYPDFDYLKEFVDILVKNPLLIIIKSRQMLATWTLMAFSFWHIMFEIVDGGLAIFASWREKEVKEMIKRIQFIYENLPWFLHLTVGTNNKMEFELAKRHARVIGLPSVSRGIRSYSPSLLLIDEAAHVENADEFYASARPAMQHGGRIILLSTPGLPVGLFFQLLKGQATGDTSDKEEGIGQLNKIPGVNLAEIELAGLDSDLSDLSIDSEGFLDISERSNLLDDR